MSPSDPSAAWTTRGRHKVMFGYSLNYLIDMEGSVIVDVEVKKKKGRAPRFRKKPDHTLDLDLTWKTGINNRNVIAIK